MTNVKTGGGGGSTYASIVPPSNITKAELVKVMVDRISKDVTAGGGSGYYKQIDPVRLAEVLVDLSNN